MTAKILKFSADWCAPCKQLLNTLTRIGVETVGYDIEDRPDLVAYYNVRSVPTLVYTDGDLVLGVLIGNKSEKDILEWLDECKRSI